jgi:hypothetical protein
MARHRLNSKPVILERYDDDGVQEVRKSRAGGPTALQRSSWRDPTDTSPTAAKTARQVSGWRTYCPLRRSAALRNSNITEMHIHAADMLRQAADAAGIGFSAEKDDMPVTSIVYGPKPGPGPAALATAKAARTFERAWKLFAPTQHAMIIGIILRNWAIEHWCRVESERIGRKINPMLEMGKLVAILEILAEHYRTEIDEGLTNGRILPVL